MGDLLAVPVLVKMATLGLSVLLGHADRRRFTASH
jgi:hypothetical protein